MDWHADIHAVRDWQRRERIGDDMPPPARLPDAVADVEAAAIHIVEALAHYEAFKGAASKAAREDAAEALLASLYRAVGARVYSSLREAAEWLVEPANAARRGRRASALIMVMFGPTIFREEPGRPCSTLGEVALGQRMDPSTLRDIATKIPDSSKFPFPLGRVG